jgi:tRNA (guanine-N7-)-methyltransferase
VSRALKHDIPGPDRRVALEALGDPDRLFPPELPRPLRLVVELGFGRGEFLMELARRDPGCAFLGVELSFKRCLKMARRLARVDSSNVRIVEGRAEEVVALLPRASVAACWINYPDPWPKKRHQRRRLLQRGFVHELALRLAPGAVLNVATDHAEYAGHVDAVLAAEPLLRNLFAPDAFRREVEERMPTAYELEWRAEGRPLHYFSYGRRAAG